MRNKETKLEKSKLDKKRSRNKKQPLIVRILRHTLSVFGWIIVISLVIFSVWTAIDRWTGYNFPFIKGFRNTVIISESMASVHPDHADELAGVDNRIQRNDIVTSILVPYEEVAINDIVIVFDGQRLICHRVVDKGIREETGAEFLITRGDANYNVDGMIDFKDNFKGKVIKITSGQGELVRFLQSPYGLLSISFAITIYATAGIISDYLSKEKEKQLDAQEQKLDELEEEIDKKTRELEVDTDVEPAQELKKTPNKNKSPKKHKKAD